MVAISAAIMSKSGKVLLARQFISVGKTRMEGYLAAFPKLVPVDNQHTIIDTETIRYLYQPLESLYLLLITNKQSNIMEDIDTLRTLAKLIPEYCLGITEDAVSAHLFELVFAFDEVIGSNGYKDAVTVAQIKTYTEMDSHEEKLQRIIQESKMIEARNEAKRKAEGIAKQREDMKKLQAMGGGDGKAHGRYSSMEGGLGGSGGGYDQEDRDAQREREREREEREREKARSKAASPSGAAAGVGAGKAKGMQLSKAKKTDDFFTQLNKEDKLPTPAPSAGGSSTSTGAAAAARTDNVRVVVREKLVVELEKDGSVRRVEVKGEMALQILDPDYSRITILTAGGNVDKAGYKSSLHPKINKQQWAQSQALGLQDASKAFPVGNDAIQIVKWRKLGGEQDIPLTLNFWPQVEAGKLAVNVEWSNAGGKTLNDVVIRIPITAEPDVSSVTGDWKYEPRSKTIVWRVGQVSAEHDSGTLEFTTAGADTDALYPISVDFTSEDTLSGLTVSRVVQADDSSKDVEFAAETKLEVEKYTIE